MPFSRRLVFTAACLGMLVFGIALTTLGAVLPSVIERFGVDTARAGSLFLLMSFGLLAGSLVFGPVVDRFGYKVPLAVCALLVLAGLEGIALAPSFAWLRLAVLAIGVGGGVINGGANALVADVSEDGRGAGLSLLGIFFGVGAVGVPFALAVLLPRVSYGAVIAGVGLIVLAPLLVTVAVRFPAPKHAQGLPVREAARLARDPALLLFGCMLFLESGMELTVGGWTATFMRRELALDESGGLYFLSLYWLGMMLARLALGSVLRGVAPARALWASIALALAGAALLLAAHALAPAAAGVFLLGAGFAAVFPTVLGLVADRYATLSGTAFSVVLVMALTGGMLLPYFTGVLGASVGLRASLLIIPAALGTLAALLALSQRRLAVARAGP